MRILHIDTSPDWRGGQLQVLLTLRGQRGRGHDAQLMALRESLLAQRAAAEAVPVHFIPSRFLRIRAAFCLREILSQQVFDVVHAHDPHALTVAWLARAHRRAALVVSRRLALPLSGGSGLARYHAARRIIAVSHFVARTVTNSGIPDERIVIVHDGVEIPPEAPTEVRHAARARWGIASNEILLGCTGYLVPGKRQDIAVRALARVRAMFPRCKLLIAGDGPDRPNLENLAGELEVASAVVFAGFIGDIESVYHALDVFIFPAVGEAFPSSLLLAMAYGFPCIAAASGGVPEIIETEENGLLIPASNALTLSDAIRMEVKGTDPEATRSAAAKCSVEFAGAIHRLLSDPALAARIGKSARKTIVDHFSADAFVEGTLNVYGSILSRS